MSKIRVDPYAICPASGLRNAACMASICDCFPDEVDRFGLHPERFVVGRECAHLERHRIAGEVERCDVCGALLPAEEGQ